MFLDYFALGVLIFVFLVIFYGIIILHDGDAANLLI
ncbi:Inner membrane protein yiaW [Escherichia coli]|nr:Inner membrane protein yiaW [Escherichia coli]VWM45089.1 Inner membrane protein yiaW [Escherichia coli]